MLLQSATIHPFMSINTMQVVRIDPSVTVLVGMNEAGKTVFLKALEKSGDALGLARFEPISDYPRKDLANYLRKHKDTPEPATTLTYTLEDAEVDELNTALHLQLKHGFTFSVTTNYANANAINLLVDESSAVGEVGSSLHWSSDALAAIKQATTLREIPIRLSDKSLTDTDKAQLATIEQRIAKTQWSNVPQWEVWEWLKIRMPKFLYFSDYDLLPSKMNLADLAARSEQAKTDPKQLRPAYRAVLALLRMADISMEEISKTGGYESLKAKIEGVSISLTDQIMEFWKQNEDLEVEVDIKADPDDVPPFNSGANLYLRIRNRRHRGMSTPFQQRSRGFIWFFSFLVWFDSVQDQIDVTGKTAPRNLVLLLDEPGLALHAKAQEDFLRYIDHLAEKHQVIYTTHSPFMVHSDRLDKVRVVEDKKDVGTVISSNVSGSDPRTIFPLQAALGWTIAQNLFISKRNLLVEGPAELIFLKSVSGTLEALSRGHLSDKITIVPVGGLDKLVTFIALLGASGLKLAVLHDYRGTPEQSLSELAKAKIVSPKSILNPSQFRDLRNVGKDSVASDTEDLFLPQLYLEYFSATYAKELQQRKVVEADLPPGDRIVDRIGRYLEKNAIQVRPNGGFNHYLVASYFASNPPAHFDDDTLNRFEAFFKSVNKILDA
ncbi:MAG TPA: AAA family ATPase [Tepidisphaeraceae bacterium]|jgi:predicted ATP-dependent endonuclease of OLD family|nr:AAA family ATPase [Tepidisphaeraceae bacterium]